MTGNEVHWIAPKQQNTYDDTRVLQAPNAFDPSELPEITLYSGFYF